MRRLKCIALAVGIAAAAALLSACGGEGADNSKTTSDSTEATGGAGGEEVTEGINLSCGDILGELLEKVDTNCDTKTVYGDGTYEEYFEYLYGVKPDKAQDGAFGYASASYADEITVIRLADAGDADMLSGKFDDRIARRKRDFEGYKPEEVAKLGKARHAVSGKYAVMAVCDDADKVIDEFLKIMGEK